MRRVFSLFIAGLLFVFAAACSSDQQSQQQEADEAQPPNIVFIMADDLGYGDLGSYGQQHINTPRLDEMAAEGTRFTQFYSGSTVCAPTRSVLMTGLHTGHSHIRGNKEIQPIGQEPLPADAYTVAELLQEAGYRTGMFGKWGLGPPESSGEPLQQGFDYYYGYLGQRRAHFYYPEFLFRNGERVPLKGNKVEEDPPVPGAGQPVERVTYSHDAIADEALSFIDRNQDRPFFMYVPFTIPHAELLAPPEAKQPYLDDAGNSIFPEDPYPGDHYSAQPMPHATYAAMVSRLDRDVGRILDRLEEQGIAENTIVFFTSDNGPHDAGGYDPTYFDGNGPLRGIKRDLYEGGIRVPMIAWGPGTVPSGRTSDAVWAQWDLLATAADISGVESIPVETDGISFWPEIRGDAQKRTHDYLYWEYYARGSAQAVRMDDWKAVRQPMFGGETELYDLSSDVGEEQNVAEDNPGVVDEMEQIMEQAHEPSEIWQVDG